MNVDIYTDARSGTSRKIQIASIMIDQDDNENHFVEKTTIGVIKDIWDEFRGKPNEFKANSTIAETFSILKSLKCVDALYPELKSVKIYTDSLNAFNFINKTNKDPNGEVGQNPHKVRCVLISTIVKSIIETKTEMNSRGIEVDIMWVEGHSGCYFNEQVDLLCKARIQNKPFMS